MFEEASTRTATNDYFGIGTCERNVGVAKLGDPDSSSKRWDAMLSTAVWRELTRFAIAGEEKPL